ncbi:hypothetical protein T440DRAFT_502849 [Plenodomus tracheiphilus IPT5]|uniref:Uncharacterized protein n=1 Tax=Plenodomus tracheiphilus IPT5 TaxID=1408161 RepID=A0A6A7AR37_9PLEO|nr:hypothetical protein T440DRAFT_502849 [Plenodomus tracheiphilus IPT5]
MSKRTAQSPLSEDEPSKKQKVASADASSKSPSPVAVLSPPTSPLSDVPENLVPPEKVVTTKKSTAAKKAVPKKVTTRKVAAPKKSTTGAVPVADTFEPWTPPQPTIPAPSPYWGIKPIMKRLNENDENSPEVADPLPHPSQPSARTSNAATNPPLWEDLGARFQRGSRYVKHLSTTAPANAASLPATIDQEAHLQIKLIDMRPTSKKDSTPRRTPITYHYGDDQKDTSGTKGNLRRRPKDWSNKQAVKCLNDRRAQAIGRICMDNSWSEQEREYLAHLFRDFPSASIWEVTARYNSRFLGDYIGATGGVDGYQSTGRTVESVRAQYLAHKPAYDCGKAPVGVREVKGKSVESKEVEKKMKEVVKTFGEPDKKLAKAYDEGRAMMANVRREEKREAEEEGERNARWNKEHGAELLELAGFREWYVEHQPTVHTPSQTSSPPARYSPQTTKDNQVAVYETEVQTETRVIKEIVGEDESVKQVATETVVETTTEAVEMTGTETVEAVSARPSPVRASSVASSNNASEKKRTASEVYQEKMKAISEDYEDDEEEEEEEEEELEREQSAS